MYQVWKKFHEIKSFVRSKNFRIQCRKQLCRKKTFVKQKLSPIVKSFAQRPVREQVPAPTAKKVDPLPLRGGKEIKLSFEPLPLPKGFRSLDRRSVWTR